MHQRTTDDRGVVFFLINFLYIWKKVMQNDLEMNPDEPAYCFNCGASNPTHTATVTIGYIAGGNTNFIKKLRPHCEDCANVQNSAFNIGIIITLAVAAIFLALYIINELF
jgi:hypothetical protein